MNRPVNPSSDNPPVQETKISHLTTVPYDLHQKVEIQYLPIPGPSHARQYRAIGLVEAQYKRSEEQLTKGTLVTSSNSEIDSVILGRLISLLKKHLDLEKQHLWVVYPRTKQENDDLHVQIVGVWEPQTLKKEQLPIIEPSLVENSDYLEPGYFSIRGEVVFANQETETVIVKIKQSAKKEGERPKFFKVKLRGKLPDKPVSHFWDLEVQLEETVLVIREATDLGSVPKKKRPFSPKPGVRRPFNQTSRTYSTPRREGTASQEGENQGIASHPVKPRPKPKAPEQPI